MEKLSDKLPSILEQVEIDYSRAAFLFAVLNRQHLHTILDLLTQHKLFLVYSGK